MKIKTFNESIINDNDNIVYVTEFSESLDDMVEEWISTIAYNTKLKDYTKISTVNRKGSQKFAIDKKLTHFKKYLDIELEIEKLENKIEKLRNLRDDKYYYNSANELLYNFQKDLIAKDFDNFYKYFMEDNIEYDNDHHTDDNIDILGNIHPKILNNKKLRNIIDVYIDVYIDSKKYNL